MSLNTFPLRKTYLHESFSKIMQKVLYWISQERFLNKDVSYLTQRVADLTHWQRRLGFLSREKTSLPREQEPTCPKIILPRACHGTTFPLLQLQIVFSRFSSWLRKSVGTTTEQTQQEELAKGAVLK